MHLAEGRLEFIKKFALTYGAPFLELEPSSKCNADCLMCPRDAMTRPKGSMAWETFLKVAERLEGSAIHLLSLCGFGEPLINPRVFDFAKLVKSRGLASKITMVTNGSLLTKEKAREMTESGLDSVAISFNGITEATYNRIMWPLKFHKTLANIEGLVSLDLKGLSVAILSVKNKICREESEHYEEFWRSRGIEKVIYLDAHNRGGNYYDPAFYDYKPPEGIGCEVFLFWNYVTWEGQYLPCDMDLSSGRQYSLGNIFDEDFKQLAKRKREVMQKNEWFPICKGCDHPHRHNLLPHYVEMGQL